MTKRGIALGLGTAAALAALFARERRRPLRATTVPQVPRLARNIAHGAASMAVVNLVQKPIIDRLSARVERDRLGLTQQLARPALRDAAAFLLLDYTMYLWHILTHRVPVLWRFHRIHHVDPDMDMTTALRFHFVDMLVSMPWRLAQVRLVGAGPRAHDAWQGFFFASVLAHHSNAALPWAVERRLARLLTLPRMHGIHHHQDWATLDSNFSSGLSIWDWLHGTARLDVPDDAVVIGVPGEMVARDTLVHALVLPALPLPTT